jgi:hypothetical protein
MQQMLGIFDIMWGPLPMYSWLCGVLLIALLVFYFGYYRKREQ